MIIQPAIGMYYVYFEGKIVLILRKVSKNSRHNGLWIATKREEHASLKADIPAITDFVFDEGEVYNPPGCRSKMTTMISRKPRSASVT
ncbi:hypothetical protein [Mucilaginibacter sp.]|uniref:hypothetical protein n=1 Tax=Mucilaginibacter sp. TaxID=1882438 RepID=UPI0026030ACE|nr:hypothetical protein [Mucilaginibacter sp.]